MKEKIKILIVDDHALVREGFAKMLELSEEFEIVGQADCAKDAITMDAKFMPDVILMDVRMPGVSGIETTRTIKSINNDVKIIILSMYDDDEYLIEALKAGASGYISKNVSLEELIKSIKAVCSGETLMAPELVNKVLKSIAKFKTNDKEDKHISKRELEILYLVSQGKSNIEIGHALHISDKTVKTHLSIIFKKLKVSDRAQAVTLAIKKGLL
jgi:DNA-binding NarL/FixJ family response regulator